MNHTYSDELVADLVRAIDYEPDMTHDDILALTHRARRYLFNNGWRLRNREWLPPVRPQHPGDSAS